MITTEEERFLIDGVKRLTRTLADLLDVAPDEVVVCGPSRHIVVKSGDGKIIAKMYKPHEGFAASDRLATEQDNLRLFRQINNHRKPLLRDVTGLDADYIGLPEIDTARLDTSRLVRPSDIPISMFNVIPGTLLYDLTLQGAHEFRDYLVAAVQIARIQQEGKLDRDFKLEHIVKDRREHEPPTSYFMRRFRITFLQQLSTYGGINIPQGIQDEMEGEWETLVAQSLLKAHREGHREGSTGYYFDGNPKHHIIDPSNRNVVSLDYEDRLLTPSFLGLASLLSFGLGKDGKPLLSEKDQEKIVDRYILEVEFVNALRDNLRDRASRIADHIKRAEETHQYDLVTCQPDEFFRFIGKDGDRDDGLAYRSRYLSMFKFAEIDRQVSWLAHKARYRAIAKALSREGQFRFENPDPVQQNAAEQRQHVRRIMAILENIRDLNGKNGRELHNAALGLYNKFASYFADSPYITG